MSSITPGHAVLVTGASGAIGFEVAAQAAAMGAIVGVHGATAQTAEAAVARLMARVPDALTTAAPADFRNSGAIAEMVDRFANQIGRIDAVIHCGIAGAPGAAGPFAARDPAVFAAHAALVLGSFQSLCLAALPHLAKQGGTIVGFASDAGRFAAPRQAVVGAAFGGIMAFVRNLSLEVAHQGVRVHCLSPSFVVDTPVYAANAARAEAASARAGLGLPSPADIAPLALFLCGPGAAKMTGQVISINGGLSA